MDYKEKIIEVIEKMEDDKFLKMIFLFAKACWKEEKEKEA